MLSLEALSASELWELLERGSYFRERLDKGEKTGKELKGRTVANMFFEPSTRTRMSFELAAQYLGAHVINFAHQGSSLVKGECLLDTAWTIEAMAVDCMVIRHAPPELQSWWRIMFGRQWSTLVTAPMPTPPRDCWTFYHLAT